MPRDAFLPVPLLLLRGQRHDDPLDPPSDHQHPLAVFPIPQQTLPRDEKLQEKLEGKLTRKAEEKKHQGEQKRVTWRFVRHLLQW